MASLKYKDPADGQWKYLLVPVAGAEVHVGPDAPTGPEELWYDTDATPTLALPTTFASKAALLAGWPAPPAGATAWLTDIKTPVIHNGTEWMRAAPYKKAGRTTPSGAPTATSATGMTNWPPAGSGGVLTVNVNKMAASSSLIVSVVIGGWQTSNPGKTDWYIKTSGGADTLLMSTYYNTLAQHQSWTGMVELGYSLSGALTLNLALWCSSGITFNTDNSDNYHMTVEEVNP